PPVLAVLLLLLNTQLWIVNSEKAADAKMPPPVPARPLAIVRPDSDTAPPVMVKTWTTALPLTVSTLAPGPAMVASAVMLNELLRAIVPTTVLENTMVFPPPRPALSCSA